MKKLGSILFLLLSLQAFSQYSKGFGGAFNIGMQTLPVTDLKVFAPEMVPLPISSIAFGGNFYMQIGKFTIGAKGGAYGGAESRDEEYVYSFTGGNFLLETGYKLFGTDRTSIYPTLALGFYKANFDIAHLGAVNLPSVTKPYLNASSWSISNVLFDVSVRLEHLPVFRETADRGVGALVGVEIGYQYSPPTDYWKAACGCPVYNVPEYSFKGFYAKIIIGGFSGQKSSK